MPSSILKSQHYSLFGLLSIVGTFTLLMIGLLDKSKVSVIASLSSNIERRVPVDVPSFSGLWTKSLQGPLVKPKPVEPITQEKTIPLPTVSLPKALKLESILYSPSTKLAVFSQESRQVTCGVGELVGDSIIVKTISKQEVELVFRDCDFTLRLQ